MWAWIKAVLHTWYGISTAAIGVALAIYYGPRQMLETWDWYLDRFYDTAILDIVRRRLMDPRPFLPEEIEFPWLVPDIAERLNRSPESVYASLLRLERRGKVERFNAGWRIK